MQDIELYLPGGARARAAQAPVFEVRYGARFGLDLAARPARLDLNMSSAAMAVDHRELWFGPDGSAPMAEALGETGIACIETGECAIFFGRLGGLGDIETSVLAAYLTVFETMAARGYGALVRAWHFIPRINAEPDGGLEVYRAFCKARATGFARSGLDMAFMPPATGVGGYGQDIAFYLVASKDAAYRFVENPLQTPAYNYPERYGPKPPSFARGGLIDPAAQAGGATVFYLSGTASIRNAETLWPGDIDRQVRTMMENVTMLIGAENLGSAPGLPAPCLKDFDHFKVYLRRVEDLDRVRRALVEDWQIAPERLYFINVELCRSDLLVEIEGAVNRAPLQG